MRILHVIDTTGPGGAETIFAELADRIRGQGFESIALLRGRGWLSETLEARAIRTFFLDAKGSFNWRFLLGLRALIHREKVDLVQCHLLGSSVYCALARLLMGPPVVSTFHGAVDFSSTGRFAGIKYWLMNHAVSRYVAVSADLAERMKESGVATDGRTLVIHNGIDLSRYSRREARRALAERLGLPADAVLVGSLGNMRPAKAYDVLLRAAIDVCRTHNRVNFVIAGAIDDKAYRALREILDCDILKGRVHFLGFCEDAASFLNGLDVFVLSSSSEGFSIATVEALAAGLPVVATKCGGPEEILTDKETGLLVPVGEPAALAQAICSLVEDGILARSLGEVGRRSVAERFSIDTMIERYAGMYRQILSA
jgi:glycosyltransferase involved in cell wall biosynthesis